jgi:predicted Fe-Mo cluster-binding NifX family protein
LEKDKGVSVKIVFTAKGSSWDSLMDPRFGRMDLLVTYDEDKDELTAVSNSETETMEHGAGPQTAKKVLELNPDIIITGNGPGGNAAQILNRANIEIYVGAGDMTIKDAYEAYKAGKLTKF